jgi:HAD superfamily hydrolase (TIGR01490 family)
MSQKAIAVFDMDGTITSRDTFLEFIEFAKGKWKYRFGFLLLMPAVILYQLKIYPNYKLKELVFTLFFREMDFRVLSKLGSRFSTEVIPRICYPAALKKIEWHKKLGHRVVILTASSGLWLDKWCSEMGVELIGTNFEVKNGKMTGKIDGENIHGKKKKEVLEKILAQNHYNESYGYGNSPSDEYFLELVKHRFMRALE